MATVGSRGASSIWMLVAVVVVAAFFYWLYATTRSLETEIPVQLPGDTTVQRFGPDDLQADPAAVIGEVGWLDTVPVAGSLGRGLFTLQLPEGRYPVLLSPDLIQLETNVTSGDWVSIYGHFFTLNDSIRSEWVERGAVSQGSENEVPESSSFMLADSVKVLM